MWLLTRVSAHVNNQHVLGLEGLLLSRAGLPAAHELLLLPVDVLIVDMLGGGRGKTRQGGKVSVAHCIQLGPSRVQSPSSHRPPPALRDDHPMPKPLPWGIHSTCLAEEHCSGCLSVCVGWGLCVHTCASLSTHAFFYVYTAYTWMGLRTAAQSLMALVGVE